MLIFKKLSKTYKFYKTRKKTFINKNQILGGYRIIILKLYKTKRNIKIQFHKIQKY